jgi:malonate transporter
MPTNPIPLASAAGLAVSSAHARVPATLADPIELLSRMAVPIALIAFGVSLVGAALPGRSGHRAQLGLVIGAKLLVQPAPAFLLGHYAFGLSQQDLLAVTVLAALPTAQNVAVHALTYDHSAVLARDAVTTSTVAAVPVIGALVVLLHR